MFCSKCGTQLPDGAKFCTTCGNQLNIQPTAPMMPVEPVAPVMETPVMDAPMMDAPVMDAPVMDAPVMDAPVMDAPVMDTPVMDAPVMDAPVMDAPVMDAPVMDAPMMDAPVMDAPIMDAPVMDVPVMDAPVMDAPVMPSFQPTMNPVDNQNPYGAPYNNMSYNNVPENTPVNPAPKKSKAPLFIGLGIAALVVAIIAIVLILVFTGDDKKKKDSKNETSTTEEITTEETTTEEPTTEEPTTEEVVVVPDVDYEDAETVVLKFMKALDSANFSKAANYILPVLDEVLKEENASAEFLAASMGSNFQDPYGDLLDYDVYAVFVDDEDNFNDFLDDSFDEGYNLPLYPSYEEPTHFAGAEIQFTYGDQTSSVYVYLAYAGGEFYIFDYNDELFDIDFEEESTSADTEDFDFETSLQQNNNFVDVAVDGTVKQFDGYTLTIPDTWTITDSNCISPDSKNVITFANPQPITPDTKLTILKTLCDTYIDMGFENLKFGNLTANGKTGYFIEADYIGVYTYIFIFVNPTEDKMFLTVLTSEDVDSDDYMDALGVAASLEIQ